MLLQSHTAQSGLPPPGCLSPEPSGFGGGWRDRGDCFEPQGLRITTAAFSPAEGGVRLENHSSGWQGKAAWQRAG